LNLSQKELGKALGVKHQQIHKYESGQNSISSSKLVQCAQFLGVPVSHFYENIHLNNASVSNDPDVTYLQIQRNKPLNILLVEDNAVDEIVTREALGMCEQKINVHTVHEGQEALIFLRNKKKANLFPRPDIVLLDLNIPKGNGLSILKEMKSDPELRDIPVVVLTNSVNPDDMNISYCMGSSGYMIKVFDHEEFNYNIELLVNYWSLASVLPSMQKA